MLSGLQRDSNPWVLSLEVCSFLFNPLLRKRVCKHSGPNGDRYSLNDVYSRLSARGGTPLYNVYRYVPPQRVWFLSRFGLKTGIDFDNYGLKSGRVFGAGNIYESLQTYFSSQNVTGTTNL